jgi:transposase-like protein
MDDAGFEALLASVVNLTISQRGQVFLALALVEASEDGHASPSVTADPMASPHPTPAGPLAEHRDGPFPAAAALDPASVTEAAHQRVRSAGCPHCASHSLQRWGHVSGLPRYRCKDCRRSFNALTGTPLARLRKKEQWAAHAQALMTGESVAKAAKRCDVAVSTAFRWRHRFLSAPAGDKPMQLNGIVEADETYIRESFKGKRSDLPRPARKRGGSIKKRGLPAEQIGVLVARDRSGKTTDAVLARHDRASITAALAGVVTSANQLCCDGGKPIVGFARRAKIPCCILPRPGGPMPGAPTLHINNVNAYHGRLKEWLRPFHGVATAYLDHYLGWRRTIEALGDTAKQQQWLAAAMAISVCQ